MNKLLIITGPTATGKTALGIHLAKKFNGEIVSADSRQVYRGLDIGTGKDKQDYEQAGVPVWGLDLVDPDYNFNVSDYLKYTSVQIRLIQRRGKLPILVGGTLLYIKSLLHPPETVHVPPNDLLRKSLANLSLSELQAKLQTVNPTKWQGMNDSDRSNPRRLIRAIEVVTTIDESTSVLSLKNGFDDTTHSNVLIISLTAPYNYLYKRIDARVDQRVEQGIIGEIQRLLDKGYTFDLPSLSATGYKEFKQFFLTPNSSPLAPYVQHWKFHEHAYARRQMTFLKKFLAIEQSQDRQIASFDISLKTRDELSTRVQALVGEWYSKVSD